MHLNRWITSMVALPLLGILILKGGPLGFAMLITGVSVMAFWEYQRMLAASKPSVGFIFIALSGLILCPLIIGAVYANAFELVLILMALNLVFCGFISLVHSKANPEMGPVVSKQVMGIVYIPLFLSFLVRVRNSASGIAWIIFLLVIVFAGDIGAYYTGSYLGRHKLAPSISPGKTIEGALGGLAANLITGGLIKHFYFPRMSWGLGLTFFLSIGIVGQAGDLFESQLKRSAHIKDSGTVLPGHGGILDRIDALLFVAPVAYLFKAYIL